MSQKKNLGGRPRTVDDGKPVSVFLDQGTLDRARKLGRGSVSAGIRLAVAGCVEAVPAERLSARSSGSRAG